MRSISFLASLVFVSSAYSASLGGAESMEDCTANNTVGASSQSNRKGKESSSCSVECTPPQAGSYQSGGEPLTMYSPAYNAPAAVNLNCTKVKVRPSIVTTFVDASFTYWYAGEEGMKIASTGVFDTGSGDTFFAQNTAALDQSFDYKPGFKVGVGLIGDSEWVGRADYTWFRGANKTNGFSVSDSLLTAGTSTALTGTEVWVVDDWFLQGTLPGQALSGSAVSSKWSLSMDLVDATAGRPFYQGQSIIVSPYAGLRAAFIRQSMDVQLTVSSLLYNGTTLPASSSPAQPIGSRNNSNSWALGPRFGCDGQWLLPMGFRLEGDLAASLLYTRYTSIEHREDPASTSFNAGPYVTSLKNVSFLRPELDVSLGFGWETYLYNRRYCLDFSASYDFMIFWSQNVIRTLLDDTLTGTGAAAADLYLHGMTLSGAFHF